MDLYDVLFNIFSPIWKWLFKTQIFVFDARLGIGWLIAGSVSMVILIRFLWSLVFNSKVDYVPGTNLDSLRDDSSYFSFSHHVRSASLRTGKNAYRGS
jgi:hypothetical protein